MYLHGTAIVENWKLNRLSIVFHVKFRKLFI